MRLYLLTVNGFPTAGKLRKNAKKFFKTACIECFGASWKSKMPPFTIGMSRLIRDQNWVLRGIIKKAAIKIADKCYDLHPDSSMFKSLDPKVVATQKQLYRKQRVAELLGPESLYLCAVDEDGGALAFAHSAVLELIHALVFCRKSNKKPLGSLELQAFQPIPLPLFAYASVALCAALEEYQSGVFVKQHFSETEYKPYYEVLLVNIKSMERSRSRGHILGLIRDYIIGQGMDEIGHGSSSVAVDAKRPPGPFVPSSDNEAPNDELLLESEDSSSDSDA